MRAGQAHAWMMVPALGLLGAVLAAGSGCGGGGLFDAPTARPERVTEADIITPETYGRGNYGIRVVPDDETATVNSQPLTIELRPNDLFAAGSAQIVSGARATLAARAAELPRTAPITIDVTGDGATPDLEHTRAAALRKFLESAEGGSYQVRAAVGRVATGRSVTIASDAPPVQVAAVAPTPLAPPAASAASSDVPPTAVVAEPQAPEPAVSRPAQPPVAQPAPVAIADGDPTRIQPAPPTPPPSPRPSNPTPPASPAQDPAVILPAPVAGLGVVEFAGSEIFEAGTFVLTADAPKILKARLATLSKRTPIVVRAFNDEKSRDAKRSSRATRELSQVRADALAEYLRSAEGGSWTVRSAVGRAFDVVDDRAPDRRIEIHQAP